MMGSAAQSWRSMVKRAEAMYFMKRLRLPTEASSLRPLTVHEGFRDQLRRINDDMPHLLAFPSVGDVDESVLSLNDRGITELLFRLVFKQQRGFPGLAILAHREIERTAAFGSVIVDKQMTTIRERKGVCAGVRIRQVCE